MKIEASNPAEYIKQIPEERIKSFNRLRKVIKDNLPDGFKETMSYGMIGYVVPHSIYPPGYHCTPSLPLPFMSIASQKNFIAVYHMGLYANTDLMNWFIKKYSEQTKPKLDMGKSCLRFKKPDEIPFELIGELSKKMSVKQWISLYEKNIKR